jgi:hypothetical protein
VVNIPTVKEYRMLDSAKDAQKESGVLVSGSPKNLHVSIAAPESMDKTIQEPKVKCLALPVFGAVTWPWSDRMG